MTDFDACAFKQSTQVQWDNIAEKWNAWVSDGAQGEAFLRMLVALNLSTTETDELIEALNTPGGYNQRLQLHMEAKGLTAALRGGLNDMI